MALRLTLLLAVVLLTACSGRHEAIPPMPGTVASTRADRAIVLVQRSKVGRGFGFFPSYVGGQRCVIHGGGPPPGLRIHGYCATRVVLHGGTRAVVVFSERWPWRSFHYSGSPRRPQHHSWRFAVSASEKVTAAGNSGDFPPQFVI